VANQLLIHVRPRGARRARVLEVLEILRSGIDEALLGLGHGSITDLNPEDLVIPNGFVLKDWEQIVDVSGREADSAADPRVPGGTRT
jgi:hypothetical protein